MRASIGRRAWFNPLAWAANVSGTGPGPGLGYRSDRMDAVFAKMRIAKSDEEIKTLTEALQTVYYEDVACVPVGFQSVMNARSARVNDPYGTLELGIPQLYNLWLSKEV